MALPLTVSCRPFRGLVIGPKIFSHRLFFFQAIFMPRYTSLVGGHGLAFRGFVGVRVIVLVLLALLALLEL